MRLAIALSGAFAVGLMGPSDAFTVTSPTAFLRQPVKLRVGNFGPGAGWDNDDFLESLSKPNEQRPIEDEVPVQELEGTLPPVQPYRGEHDENQGGSRFKAMMEAAQRAKAEGIPARGTPPINPYAANPFAPPAAFSNAPPPPTLTIDPAEAEKLSVEQQAALFRQMMEQRQSQAATSYNPPVPGPPTMIGGLDAKGRKIGRNRDTDTIANTSDLYFAQLKRDSSVRNMARIQGDEEFADKIFADPSVKQLEVELKENPYLQKEKDENKGMFQAMAEEMKQFQIRQAANQPDAKDMGPKYKDIMAAKKAKKSRGAIPTPPPAPVVAVPAPVPAPVPAAAEIPAPVPVPAPIVAQVPAPAPVVAQVPVPVPAVAQVPPPAPVVAHVPAPAPAPIPTPAVTSQATQPMEETELTKRKIRELQGLFLKHRGGPGFGSGRLRGSEVEQFEETLKSVGAQLRADAGPRTEAASTVPAAAAVVEPIAVAVPAPAPIPSPSPVMRPQFEAHAPLITPPPRPDTSAMTTFTTGSVDPRLQGSLACVEGALQMYKNCSPEIQQGMLMALRAALLSAANSCQQVIEGTVDQTSYTPPPPQPVFTYTAGAQDATIEESGEEPVVDDVATVQDAMPSGNDSNTLLLRKVYDSLSAASGGGKFGLGPISAGEASDIVDLVMDMRSILMAELDSGIPDDDAPVLPTPTTGSAAEPPRSQQSGGTSSTYQKMLAKARAAKKQN